MYFPRRSIRQTLVFGLVIFSVCLAAAAAYLSLSPARAQTLTPEALRALEDRNATTPETPTNKPVIQTYQPVAPTEKAAPPSRLEALYSLRAGRPLTQFGYDFLGVPSAISVAQSGAVQDSYVLGAGDELEVVFRGQENSTYRVRIDRNGRIVLPKLNPILAAGRTFGDFRQELESQVAQAFISTRVFVSLGEVRQLSVLVTGDVRSPGMRIVSALATPLDAILLSGGIGKTGSLRRVQLVRSGERHIIDLYAILAQGGASSLGMLRDGDRIFVPALGPTVAVSGSVRRPGIYELPAGASGIRAKSLIDLAGGIEIAGSYDLSKTLLNRDGTTNLVPVVTGGTVQSGEVLFVDVGRNAGLDHVTLMGAVLSPGTRPLSTARTVSSLVRSSAELTPDAYTPFAIILRHNAQTRSAVIVPFSLARALTGESGPSLQSDDTVFVFSSEEVRALGEIATKEINAPYEPGGANHPEGAAPTEAQAPVVPAAVGAGGAGDTRPDIRPIDLLGGTTGGAGGADIRGKATNALGESAEAAGALGEAQALARAQAGVTPRELKDTDAVLTRLAATLQIPKDSLTRTARDNLVWVLDSVRVPGPYLAGSGTRLSEMIEAAQGALNTADLSDVEVTSSAIDQIHGTSTTSRNQYAISATPFSGISIQPNDVIRLRPIYSDREFGTVVLAGQLRYPGIFDITRNEHLSSVLQRAGGLTEIAYPYGAIFTRRSVALAEKEGNERVARELETEIALTPPTSNTQTPTNPNQLNYVAVLIKDIREAPTLGRVTVIADPTVLATRPELDPLLEPGDTIYIPKRPSSVSVSGEVLKPGAFQYRGNTDVEGYVRLAGGYTAAADEGHAFVVLPDGSAAPLGSNWLSFSSGNIPPGSTIVVPRDFKPFDWTVFLKDATQIVSQLAITAASLAVLRNN